jgi:hypothetical protein
MSNAQFSKVENLAGHLSALSTANAAISNATVNGSLNVGNLVQDSSATSTTVYGYAPTQFATAVAGTSVSLLTQPGVTQATALTAANLLHLPASSTITRVVVTNNGTAIVGGTSFTIGTNSALLAASLNGAPTTTPVVAMLLATVNAAGGGSVGGTAAVTELALGTAGQVTTTSTLAGQAQGAFDNLVSVTTNGTNNTAGDLLVCITYTNA